MSLIKYFENSFLSVPKYRTYLWITIFLSGFALRCLLIFKFPSLYSWDAFTRLWDSEYIVVRRWLPLPQLPILVAHHLGLGLFFVRVCYALIGSLGAVVFGIGISRILGVFPGMGVALLTTFLGSYFKFSLAPYQEGMFLLFFGLYFVYGPFNRDEIKDQKNWLGSFCLALACLCRYESWLFLAVIASGMVIRKKWQVVKSLIPVFFVPLLWLLIYKHVPAGDGPPRLGVAGISLGAHLFSDLIELSELAFKVSGTISLVILIDITMLGIVLQFLGIFSVLRKDRSIIGREFLFFWFLLAGLVFARGVNVNAVTDRMILLLNVVGAVYIVIGVEKLSIFLKNRFIERAAINDVLMACLFSLLLSLFIYQSLSNVSQTAMLFSPEYNASLLLKKVPQDKTVLIQPRNLPNILKESSIGGIFANAFGELDHRDERFIFGPNEPQQKKQDYYLKWTGERYRLLEKNKSD